MEAYCLLLKRLGSADVLTFRFALTLFQLVEILFARGLVKILFATETFAMVCQSFSGNIAICSLNTGR